MFFKKYKVFAVFLTLGSLALFFFQNCGAVKSKVGYSSALSASDMPVILVNEENLLNQAEDLFSHSSVEQTNDSRVPSSSIDSVGFEPLRTSSSQRALAPLRNMNILVLPMEKGVDQMVQLDPQLYGRSDCEPLYDDYLKVATGGDLNSFSGKHGAIVDCLGNYPHAILKDIESHVALNRVQDTLKLLYSDYLKNQTGDNLRLILRSGRHKFLSLKKLDSAHQSIIKDGGIVNGVEYNFSSIHFVLDDFIANRGLDYIPETQLVLDGGEFRFEVPSNTGFYNKPTDSPVKFRVIESRPLENVLIRGVIPNAKNVVICITSCEDLIATYERIGKNDLYDSSLDDIYTSFLTLNSSTFDYVFYDRERRYYRRSTHAIATGKDIYDVIK